MKGDMDASLETFRLSDLADAIYENAWLVRNELLGLAL